MSEEEAIELLKTWVKDDRDIRNNSTESDFDKFCEERNIAIEITLKKLKELEEENEELRKGQISLQEKIDKYKKNIYNK